MLLRAAQGTGQERDTHTLTKTIICNPSWYNSYNSFQKRAIPKFVTGPPTRKTRNCLPIQYTLTKQSEELTTVTLCSQVPQITLGTVTVQTFKIFFFLFITHRDSKDPVLNHNTPHAIV